MNLKINTRQLEMTDDLRSLIERQAAKVRKLLPTFAARDLDLNVQVEQLSTKKQFHTSLSLSLPQKAIHVEDIEASLTKSVVQAFGELVRRVKRFKSKLNREKFWKRDSKLGVAPVEEPGTDREDEYQESLEKIENYIRREIYHRAIQQGLPQGILQPHALVDEVYLEVTSNRAGRPENLSPEQYMFQVARQTLGRKLEEIEEDGKNRHVEEPSREKPDWEDEDLNFFQPDEELKLEDLLTDEKAATPEEYLAGEEMEEQLQKAIAELPSEIRESFILFSLEGFNSDEVAMITSKTPREVLDSVQQARQLLRETLQQAGA